jgi:tRNA-specific 2-thiouridylase
MRTAVLLSGGVDSSVALLRLAADLGPSQLVAVYLKIWLEDELAFLGSCPWAEDMRHAQAVCSQLGVPLEVVSLQQEYHCRVVAITLEELKAGRTPSPDVLCNRQIKLGAAVDLLGDRFGRFATGHHARLERSGGELRLLRGVDPVKDQAYFLCQLTQQQLERAVFPIGDLTKHEVRAMATAANLPTAMRPDSQGICFLGQIPYDAFVEHQLGEQRGEIRDVSSGDVLGRHRGLWFYTIGQRRGLGLAGGPWYVVEKDLASNILWIVHGDRRDDLARRTFRVSAFNQIGTPPPGERFKVRLRHGPSAIGCTVQWIAEGVEVELDQPDPGVATGQFAVLYDGDRCVGGGPIDEIQAVRPG